MEEEFDKMFDKLVAQATIIEEQWRRGLYNSNRSLEQASERKKGENNVDNRAKKMILVMNLSLTVKCEVINNNRKPITWAVQSPNIEG